MLHVGDRVLFPAKSVFSHFLNVLSNLNYGISLLNPRIKLIGGRRILPNMGPNLLIKNPSQTSKLPVNIV